jgi:hypothetical protein
MRNRTRIAVLLLVPAGLAGCTGSSSTTPPTAPSPVSPSPVSPSPTPPVPQPQPGSFYYGPGYVLMDASLSGVVFEVTATGHVPIPGVSVYCDACGEFGHTAKTTDKDGFYSFSGDIAGGGGMWLPPSNTAYLIVRKEGYRDPPGLPPGPRDVTVKGDTRFDIQLVR